MRALFIAIAFLAGVLAHVFYRKAKYGKLDRGLERIYQAVKELDMPKRNWVRI